VTPADSVSDDAIDRPERGAGDEEIACVRVELDVGRFVALHVPFEIRRDEEDRPGRRVTHLFLRRIEILGAAHDFRGFAGVQPAGEKAAERGVVAIDHDHREIAEHLLQVRRGVEERVEDAGENQEPERLLVPQHSGEHGEEAAGKAPSRVAPGARIAQDRQHARPGE
jgi:hypothetical protein